jgi:hypothetical protein
MWSSGGRLLSEWILVQFRVHGPNASL